MSAGIYVAFKPLPDRVKEGARITTCNRCSKLVGHRPLDSIGHEIVCVPCASEIPAIRRHIDQLAKEREL